MLQEKICKLLLGQYSKKEDSNLLNYTPSYSWGVRKSFFISVAPMVCVSREFVYGAVDVNKVSIFLIKLPSYAYAQVNAKLKLNHSWSTNPW